MSRAAAVLVAWTLCSSSSADRPREPASSAGSAASRLRPGIFLYAAPALLAPPFAETVVLLIDHGPEGSMGLVVNRPTDLPLHEALDEARRPHAPDVPVYWGGPVQPEALFALVRATTARAGTRSVLPGVQLTGNLDEARRAWAEVVPRVGLRVYSGYAGWAAGQLAGEVRAGAWVLDRADTESIFAADPSGIWRKVHRLLYRQEARGGATPDVAQASRTAGREGSGVPSSFLPAVPMRRTADAGA